MTTIACDRFSMAGDSRATDGNTNAGVVKVHRVHGWLLGVAGEAGSAMELIGALKSAPGGSPLVTLRTASKERLLKPYKGVQMLMLSPTGDIYLYEGGNTSPYQLTDDYAAVGSGAQAALGALHAGSTPKEAVRAARRVDPNTGGRVVSKLRSVDWKY